MAASLPNQVSINAELGRRRLSFFVRYMWETIIAEELIWNWHMTILCDEVQAVYERVFQVVDDEGNIIKHRQEKAYDLIINVPPGTSKSTIVSEMAPAWGWTRDASLKYICGSFVDTVSEELAEHCRNIILSAKYQQHYPEVQLRKDRNKLTNFKNIYGGQRLAVTVGSGFTGIHAHIINIDDPMDPKGALSPAKVLQTTRWMDNTLPNRKVNKLVTPTILVMQRLSTVDPTGHLVGKAKKGLKIRWICLPASISDRVRPAELKQYYIDGLLDPVRMPHPVLAELKINMGTANFAGQYDQTPVPDGGLIWKKWFIEVPDEAFPSRDIMQRYGTDWDTAYTKEDVNAASAYATAGVIDNRIYIDDIGWDWLEFPKLIRWMKTKPSPHYIEAKASGKSAKQVLIGRGIVAIEVAVKGGDKVARANIATPYAEAGMVYIRKSIADRLYNDSRQGILFFPKGAFADMADVLAQCLQRLGKKGGGYTAQEEVDMDDYDDLLEAV